MVTLEPITPKRAMVLKDMRLRALQEAPEAFSSTYANESQISDAAWVARAAQWSNEKSAGYLAMDDGIACGIACGLLDELDTSRAHLLSMWVAPCHRRSGIGRSLVEAILDWAGNEGARTLLLQVTSNNDAAITFYRRLGFTMTGRTETYVNDAALLNLEMARTI
jgi:ribosomal protein S18 acetylase RimI-like enzyme